MLYDTIYFRSVYIYRINIYNKIDFSFRFVEIKVVILLCFSIFLTTGDCDNDFFYFLVVIEREYDRRSYTQ